MMVAALQTLFCRLVGGKYKSGRWRRTCAQSAVLLGRSWSWVLWWERI